MNVSGVSSGSPDSNQPKTNIFWGLNTALDNYFEDPTEGYLNAFEFTLQQLETDYNLTSKQKQMLAEINQDVEKYASLKNQITSLEQTMVDPNVSIKVREQAAAQIFQDSMIMTSLQQNAKNLMSQLT